MRTARRVLACCATASFVHLAQVAATVPVLNKIEDLKRIQSNQPVPRNSLQLLHWFANQVDVHSFPLRLSFHPNSDYGSHYYSNSEWLLPCCRHHYKYFTVGNLNTDAATRLPDYIRYSQHCNEGYNRARIVFSANGQTIDRVYLTQHFGNNSDSSYDAHHTYEISAGLLRELQQVSRWDLQQVSRRDLHPFYTHNSQMQSWHNPVRNVPAAVEQSDWKWAFIFIVLIIVLIFIVCTAKISKDPLRY